MTTRVRSLLQQAALLTLRQRIELVEELLLALEPAPPGGGDEVLREEIERRSRSAKDGSTRLVPWHRVKAAARRRARGRA